MFAVSLCMVGNSGSKSKSQSQSKRVKAFCPRHMASGNLHGAHYVLNVPQHVLNVPTQCKTTIRIGAYTRHALPTQHQFDLSVALATSSTFHANWTHCSKRVRWLMVLFAKSDCDMNMMTGKNSMAHRCGSRGGRATLALC
jgi:hypothetical protein